MASPSSSDELIPSSRHKKRRIQIHESSCDDDDNSSSSSFSLPRDEDSWREELEDGTPSSEDEEGELREGELFERWRSDRPLIRKLSEDGAAIYDSENLGDFAAAPVPPARDAVGEYDVRFVLWDASEEGSRRLFSRTVSRGSLVLAHETGGGDDDARASYARLQGEIRLEGLTSDGDDDGQSMLPPYGTRTRFSFSSADVDVGTTVVRATVDGEDIAGVDPPESSMGSSGSRTSNNDDDDDDDDDSDVKTASEYSLSPFETDSFDLWSEPFWAEVTLQWFGGRRSLSWIPNDACGGDRPYARALRRTLRMRRRGRPSPDHRDRVESSWLHRRKSLPGPVVQKILDYNAAFLPETTEPFWIEPADLLVSIRLGAHLGDALDLRIVARKK